MTLRAGSEKEVSRFSNTSAIVLAAGEGRRLGHAAKALLRLEGTPLVVRLIHALHTLGVTDICVITGAHHDRIASVVEPLGARAIRNISPEMGQAGSVRLGLEATDASRGSLMILLCDQPLLDSADLAELLHAFARRSSGEFCVPVVAGQRGNPVILTQKARQAVLAMGAPNACRDYMNLHPASVCWHATSNDHYVFDIDTADDVKLAETRTRQNIEFDDGPG